MRRKKVHGLRCFARLASCVDIRQRIRGRLVDGRRGGVMGRSKVTICRCG